MWAEKARPGINDDAKLARQIGKLQTANAAVLRLKDLIGVRKYMRDAEIEKILSKQKWRIGHVLDQIETHFLTQTRPGYATWKKQDMKKLWDTYMDAKFETGKSRIDYDMRRHLRTLEVRYAPRSKPPPSAGLERQVYDNVQKLAKEWNKEKALTWQSPWVKRPIGANGAFT